MFRILMIKHKYHKDLISQFEDRQDMVKPVITFNIILESATSKDRSLPPVPIGIAKE